MIKRDCLKCRDHEWLLDDQLPTLCTALLVFTGRTLRKYSLPGRTSFLPASSHTEEQDNINL